VLPALGWASVASLVALLQAAAVHLDFKLGAAFAIACIAGVIVVARPTLLLPLSMVVISLEVMTLNGIAVTRLLAPGALMLVLLETFRGTARLRPGPPLAWTGALVTWAIASGAWSISPGGTRFMLQSLAIALVFMFAFAALVNTERDVRHLIYTLAFTAALVGGLSVIAFGGDLELPGLDLLQGGRSQGGVGDPDFFAALQLVAVPLVLVAASEVEDKRARLFLYGCVLAILASIFTSLSRGAFLAVIVLGILFLASRPDRLFRSREEKLLAVIVIALGMVAFFSRPYLREQVVTRAETIYAPKNKADESGSGRTEIWKAAARTAADNPLLGLGLGAFGTISQELILKTPGIDLEAVQDREEGDYYVAHNTYIGLAADLGLTGLLLYLGLMISTATHLRRTAARAAALGRPFVGRVAHALLLGLASWAVTSFFLSGETSRMFWIIVGLSLALPKLLPERIAER
jgi:putative inorganic carbon (HCO3(-)) transporter